MSEMKTRTLNNGLTMIVSEAPEADECRMCGGPNTEEESFYGACKTCTIRVFADLGEDISPVYLGLEQREKWPPPVPIWELPCW